MKLGIDTGNVDSVFDMRIAESWGFKPASSTPSTAAMFRAAIPPVHVGGVVLDVTPAMVMNLAEMIEKGQIPRIDGTLAYSAFKDRVIELDIAAKRLRISESLKEKTNCGRDCDKIALIPFGKQGPNIVVAEGFEINGKKVSAQIDTMYTGSLLIYTASIAKIGLSTEAMSTETEMFPLTDGGVSMKVAKAKSESFHGTVLGPNPTNVYFPTPEVHEPDGLFDATVGLVLFQSAVLRLDFHNMTVAVTRK